MLDFRLSLIKNITNIYQRVPDKVYVVLLLLLAISTFLFFILKDIKCKRRALGLIILVEYVALLYCSTVLFRSLNKGAAYSLLPFWKYKAVFEGKSPVLIEILLNVAMFVPIGFLLGVAFKKSKFIHVLLSSLLLSVSIEIMQLVLNRGFCEFDDVIHNTLGCVIGYGACWLISKQPILTYCKKL